MTALAQLGQRPAIARADGVPSVKLVRSRQYYPPCVIAESDCVFGISRYRQVAHPDAEYVPPKELRDLVRKLVREVDDLRDCVVLGLRPDA